MQRHHFKMDIFRERWRDGHENNSIAKQLRPRWNEILLICSNNDLWFIKLWLFPFLHLPTGSKVSVFVTGAALRRKLIILVVNLLSLSPRSTLQALLCNTGLRLVNISPISWHNVRREGWRDTIRGNGFSQWCFPPFLPHPSLFWHCFLIFILFNI